jgi:nucleotide-binding universal stress UspA family protein
LQEIISSKFMESKKKNIILVPTDFSYVAVNALAQAIQIAKLFDNEIALLHINEEGMLDALISRKNEKDLLIEEALENRMHRMAADIKKDHGINVYVYIKPGKIYKQIVETAQEIGCDSIVMGTHGASGIKQIIGSNASRVISHSTVPVVVVKEKVITDGYKNIVLPIDLTSESKQKVWWANHLAKAFKSTIHVVTEKETDEFLKNRITANLAYVERSFAENNTKYTTATVEGNFAMETIRYAEKINADLIMIMTQQEKGFAEYIIGSYAQQIVNNASAIPVMCINPKEVFVMDGIM